jgi:hypothetical protein
VSDPERTWASIRRGLRAAVRFYVGHILLPIGTTLIAIGLFVWIQNVAPQDASGETIGGWWSLAALGALVLGVVGLVALVSRLQGGRETRAQKIQRLTKALNEATQAIAQISAEMEDGAHRLRELERQTSIQKELANLSATESAAVRDALKGELSRERRRGLMRDLFMVVLGAAISLGLTRLFP